MRRLGNPYENTQFVTRENGCGAGEADPFKIKRRERANRLGQCVCVWHLSRIL